MKTYIFYVLAEFCENIFNLEKVGKKWHDRRKIITPAFHFQMLERFAETFDRLANTFINKLYEYDVNADIDLFHLVGLFALDVVCGMYWSCKKRFIKMSLSRAIFSTGELNVLLETAMGVSIDALSKPDSDYIAAVQE